VGEQALDLTLAVVSCSAQQLVVVLVGQVRRQQGDGREVQLAQCDHVEDAGETAGGARGLNAQVRARLRHVQALDAVAVHAAACVLEVEPAAVDLGEVYEEASGEATVFRDQALELTDELCVGQRSDVLGQGSAAVRHVVLLGVFVYHGTLTVLLHA
jgi:hypothetical protein